MSAAVAERRIAALYLTVSRKMNKKSSRKSLQDLRTQKVSRQDAIQNPMTLLGLLACPGMGMLCACTRLDPCKVSAV
eukprot:SAG31_NODE_4603_length_3099_cov_2.042971_1_plen_76_part_10